MKDYIQILKDKQQEPQSTRLPTAQEVVIEVGPRIFLGAFSSSPLNMASQSLSILSTSVTKATLDRVSKNLTVMEGQAIFTHPKQYGPEYPDGDQTEILFKNITNFALVLLKMIADVAKIHMSKIFDPHSSLPDVFPNEELPFESLRMSNSLPSEGSPFENLSVPNVTQVKEPPSVIK